MKKLQKWLVALCAGLLAAGLLAACGQKPASGAAGSGQEAGVRTVTDMAGREVEIPHSVEKVFPASPNDGIVIYTLAPDRLLGWNYELNELERKMILSEYQDLPVYGMGEKINYEAVIAAGPEVCVQTASLANPGVVQDADKLQKQLGIPVLVLSTDLADTPDVYTFLGDVLGLPGPAAERAAYARRVLEEAQAAVLPAQRVRVYYGNGPDSLETAPRGSVAAEALELAGLENVAELELGQSSRVDVSLEQVLQWNPELIVVNGDPKQGLSGNGAAQAILANPAFAEVQAVQQGRVYGIPKSPFSWTDRPQGPNRLIGVRWAGHLAYPEVYTYDMDAEVRAFYSLFYHIELTDEQLAALYTD